MLVKIVFMHIKLTRSLNSLFSCHVYYPQQPDFDALVHKNHKSVTTLFLRSFHDTKYRILSEKIQLSATSRLDSMYGRQTTQKFCHNYFIRIQNYISPVIFANPFMFDVMCDIFLKFIWPLFHASLWNILCK